MVSLQNTIESHARFATTASPRAGSEDVDITVTVWVGGRRGSITGNDANPDALKRIGEEAVQIARVSPMHREYVPTLGPLDYPASRGFAAARDVVSPLAPRPAIALAACRTAKVRSGVPHREASAIAAATANGNRRNSVEPGR